MKGHQHRWFAGDYDLEIGHFYLVDSGFCAQCHRVVSMQR